MYGPIAVMACAQVCASIPNFAIFEFQWADAPWRDYLLDMPIPIKDGYIEVPSKPGMGIEINRDKLYKHAVE